MFVVTPLLSSNIILYSPCLHIFHITAKAAFVKVTAGSFSLPTKIQCSAASSVRKPKLNPVSQPPFILEVKGPESGNKTVSHTSMRNSYLAVFSRRDGSKKYKVEAQLVSLEGVVLKEQWLTKTRLQKQCGATEV